MSYYYILDGKAAIPADILAWGAMFKDHNKRRVARTEIGDATVSTVFLGLDHSFGDGPQLLFETMVFGGSLDEEMERYTTWEQAEAGHAVMVGRVKASQE